MCIPHAPVKTFKSQRRSKAEKPKKSAPFDKKLLDPDPKFIDERKSHTVSRDVPESLLDNLLSIFKRSAS